VRIIFERIESPQNPTIQRVKGLHRASNRRAAGLLVAEGTHLVLEAMATHWPFEECFFTDRWKDSHPDLCRQLTSKARVVSDRVLRAMSTTDSPDGVVAVIKRLQSDETLSPFQAGLALEAMQDPGNVGTLIRSCVASGFEQVFVGDGSVSIDSPKVLRSSAGQWFRCPPKAISIEKLVDFCQANSIRVIAAAMEGEPMWTADLTGPVLIVLGNEGAGLSQTIKQRADCIVSVPMTCGVESLNAAMTGTLLMYECLRQRMQVG
jgi:RNA methyltransferase, TrmH family